MQQPTVGRIVRYFPASNEMTGRNRRDHAAIVIDAFAGHVVNLKVLFSTGEIESRTDVRNIHNRGPFSHEDRGFWDWPEIVREQPVAMAPADHVIIGQIGERAGPPTVRPEDDPNSSEAIYAKEQPDAVDSDPPAA